MDKFEQDYINDIVNNSDGSEKRIGDFIIRNDYGANVYYDGQGGDVIIPEEIGSASLLFAFANKNSKKIRSLQYPSCIEAIWADITDSSHFCCAASIEKLVFSEGLKSIWGSGAFTDCKKLKEVIIPDSLEYLGSSAFKNTPWYKEHLEKVDGCHYLGRFLVASDKDITHASVREGTIMICGYAFRERCSLVSIDIPNTVKTIGKLAFNGCNSLKELRFPESVTTIEESCFSGCASLEYFEILNSNINIASNAFGSKRSEFIFYPRYAFIPAVIDCSGIEKQIYSYCYLTSRDRHPKHIQEHYDAIIKKMKSNLLDLVLEEDNLLALKNIAPLAITKGNIDFLIKTMQKKDNPEIVSFLQTWKKEGLSTSDLPNSPEQKSEEKDPYNAAEMNRLWSSQKLEDGTLVITSYKGDDYDIEIPPRIGKNKVTKIGENAISPYKNWTLVHRKPANRASALEKIRSVTIPEGITEIGKAAFGGCNCLETIKMPESIITICDMAFGECNSLERIKIPSLVKVLSNNLFKDCSSLTDVSLPEGLTKIGYSAFNGCASLKEITLPESITTIEDQAFCGCTGLADEQGLTIVRGVLYDCNTDREVIRIPDGVKGISSMFSLDWNAPNLKDIFIPDSVVKIGYGLQPNHIVKTIHCKSGSYAEEYAKEQGIPYIVED